MQRAMIGGIRSWDTTVVPSVFPDNSFKQHIYVIDQVWGQRGLVLAELLFLGIFMDRDKFPFLIANFFHIAHGCQLFNNHPFQSV